MPDPSTSPGAPLATLARHAAALLGGTITGMTPLSGGDLAAIACVWLDDRPVVVKNGPSPLAEAAMLRALRDAGAPTPDILACDDHVLVLSRVAGADPMRGAWSDLGHVLRRMHAAPVEAVPGWSAAGPYGWSTDHAFGTLPVANAWRADWAAFWAEHRLLPHLAHVPADIARRIEALARRIGDRLPADPRPALLHGDLWSGNVMARGTRIAALIDPSCCIGHAEADFGMLTLFARPGADFHGAYGEPEPGAAERIALYRLWPALVHLRLFGGGYHEMVTAVLDEVMA